MSGKKKNWIIGIIFIIVALAGSQFSVYASERVNLRQVKVGFFYLDGYHMEDEDGVKSGYGYELLQRMNVYEDWQFQYVGYEKSWSDMQEMLEKGEIDILTSAQKTEDRLEKFSFSESSIGSSSTILTVKAANDKILSGDYDTYEGMRVGMVEGNSRNDSFDAFASEKGFSYTSVYFDDFSSMQEALQDGSKIDAIVSSNLRRLENEWVLDTFDTSPFYAIVKKGNEELLNEVNYALKQMNTNDAQWQTNLWEKYYKEEQEVSLQFSSNELAFLKEMNDQNITFSVLASPDRAPYSYYEDGELKGIVPDIFAKIAEECGIQYEIVAPKDRNEYQKIIENGEADILLDAPSDYTWAEENNCVLTDSYLTTSISEITKKDFHKSVNTVAIRPQINKKSIYAIDLIYSKDCTEYATLKDCIDAVKDGSADATYVHTYCAQSILDDDKKNELKANQIPEYMVDFDFAVQNDIDHRLIAILNKGVHAFSDSETQGIILGYTTNSSSSSFSLISYYYDHPLMVMLVLIFVILIIFVIIFLMIKVRNNRKLNQQSRELERMMGYVCRYNESVMEVNLKTNQCRRFYQKDGKLQMVTEPHNPDDYYFQSLFHPDDFKELEKKHTFKRIQKMMPGNDEISFTARAKTADGSYQWYDYNIQALERNNDHPANYVLFKKNVNEEWEKEEQQKTTLKDALESAKQASMAKGSFLSRMSHEIRTPLNAVIGYMSMAQTADGNMSKIMHCVSNSEIAAKHLLSIINDVLDISAIESGKMKIALEDFDLKSQISSITSIFFNQTKEKNIGFEVKIQELTEEWVVGDKLRLNQVLMNLLSNAVKFTPAGGLIELRVIQAKLLDSQVFIKFVVSDTGIGMSEEYKSRLFTAFEQESASTAQRFGGTGLGLAISKNLVTMMGGSIDVESKQGEGTTFTVAMQFARSQKNNMEQENAAVVDYSHLRALVVDDEKGDCQYIKSLLKRCGMKSDTAYDGNSAIRQIKRRQGSDYAYDLCIMDWNMPNMDGLEAAKRIKQEFGDQLPIIIATAYDISEFAEAAKEIGITKIVSKPLFQSTVFDLLVSNFGKYQMAESEKNYKVDVVGMRVLLAEDNEMNMEIAVDVLEKAGVVVTQATDGQEVVDKFMEAAPGTYQLILMDVQMPKKNGYEATGMIRSSAHPQAKTIPIIAMTANAFAEDVAEAISKGMNDHISKPIDQTKLFRVLEKFKNR